MRDKKKAYICTLIGIIGISCSAILCRLTTCTGLVTATWRLLFAAVLLLPAFFRNGLPDLRTASKKEIGMCMLSGVFFGLHLFTYLEAVKRTSIAASVVLVDTEVIFVALFLLLVYHERITKAAFAGILLTLAGSTVIAGFDAQGGGSGSAVFLGDLLALLGAVLSSAYTILGRNVRKTLSNAAYVFIVNSTAGLAMLLICLLSGQQLLGLPGSDYLACLGLAVFCTVLGHCLFSYSLKYLSATFVSLIKLMEPVFSTLLGILIFIELPSLTTVLGGILVIAGIVFYMVKSRD